jgi:hypothetical protein
LGTQPTLTQVPPRRPASISAQRAPWLGRSFRHGQAAAAAADGDEIVMLDHASSSLGGRDSAKRRVVVESEIIAELGKNGHGFGPWRG